MPNGCPTLTWCPKSSRGTGTKKSCDSLDPEPGNLVLQKLRSWKVMESWVSEFYTWTIFLWSYTWNTWSVWRNAHISDSCNCASCWSTWFWVIAIPGSNDFNDIYFLHVSRNVCSTLTFATRHSPQMAPKLVESPCDWPGSPFCVHFFSSHFHPKK